MKTVLDTENDEKQEGECEVETAEEADTDTLVKSTTVKSVEEAKKKQEECKEPPLQSQKTQMEQVRRTHKDGK